MLNELKLLRNVALRIGIIFLALVVVFIAIPIPFIESTVADAAIEAIRSGIIPEGSALAVMNPLDPFLTQATVAAAISMAFIIPAFFIELFLFASPGLTARERAYFIVGLFVALFLAALGGIFAYKILIPVMFNELFAFLPQGVEALFNLREVLSLVVGFTLGTALLFLLPLLMTLLSAMGLIPPRVWRASARPAVLLVLVLSAIITPDGSGVGMILLALPVIGLYALGYAGARALTRGKE